MADTSKNESPALRSGMATTTAGLLKTDGGQSKSNALEMPAIALPSGGGAIKSIDEKFSVNAVNGTATLSIPLPFSATRSISPSMNLTYSSGAGNGIFGLGWSHGLASIKRKTNNTLPQYAEADESDTFILSGAEDLVPVFKRGADGSFVLDNTGDYVIDKQDSTDGLFIIRYYRPRTEGLFARIEKWSSKTTAEVKWRMITRDNSTTLFGWTAASRVSDPANDAHIFEWLPEFVFDDKGNCSHYFYKKEDEKGIDPSLLQNKHRLAGGKIRYTNLYPEKVLYGNTQPYRKMGDAFLPENNYLFETLFDYGEYAENPPYNKIGDWTFRTDPFSDYKAGFEIRTTRLCRRVLLFHRFNGINEYSGLVKSLNFSYDTAQPPFTLLGAVTVCGYNKKEDGSYSQKKLPPVEFGYQLPAWNTQVSTIEPAAVVNAAAGIDEDQYLFTDLYNEGLSGILSEQANGWYYKKNLGDGKFEPAQLVSSNPNFTGLGRQLQLADLDADGGKQLVNYNSHPQGFFELNDDGEWQAFRNFNTLPNINFTDANTRMIDLNGDGKPEMLISGEHVFTWYASEGRQGFASARKTFKSTDEDKGPALVFADEKQTLFLADMSGDGLTDLVRIRNGEVCYWPNLGYGKFGEKCAVDNAPYFDHPGAFNPSLLKLADTDGSGLPDIIYLGNNTFTCWMNLNGNAFSNAVTLPSFPEINLQAKISVVDLLGNGVPCIVWSDALAKNTHAPVRYIDLMSGKKPYVMVSYKNNLGKEISLEYTASTKFYINDKLGGHPWATKLHFPVQCVSRTEARDLVAGTRFVTTYAYHHGYYDHAEREFRGFGMVEQTDAEFFEDWVKGNGGVVADHELQQEPVISKNWFHTGAFINRENILSQFEHEYWYHKMQNQGFAITLHEKTLTEANVIAAPYIPASVINTMSAIEWRQALRACKGTGLRTEVFAMDAQKNGNTPAARMQQLTPYTVSTHNCTIELLQPKGKNKYAVFVVKEYEAITYNYERDAEDPRIAHQVNTRIDEWANVLESATIVYPRLMVNPDLPTATRQAQAQTTILYNSNLFTNDVISTEVYRLRLPAEAAIYELKNVQKTGPFYRPSDFTDILLDTRSDTALYHELDKPPGAKAQKRLIEHTRSVFYRNNLTGALPLYQLESLALPLESYQLAYTPELLSNIFSDKQPNPAIWDALMAEGKFVHTVNGDNTTDNNWWVRSGSAQLIAGAETNADAQNRFYMPVSYTDGFGATTVISYYSNYFLLIEKITDALGNSQRVQQFNFRTLSPQRVKDINGNLSAVVSDELGIIKASAQMGKGNEADDLNGINEFTDAAETALINNFFTAPDSVQLTATGKNLLQHATARFVYNLYAFITTGKPAVMATILREQHFAVNNNSPVQISFEYSNGLGKVVMKKIQAEPGIAKKTTVLPDNSYTLIEVDTSIPNPKQLRWIGTGKTVLNNKGNAVKQYEPYFSVSPQYENFKELVETGVSPVIYYDAAARVLRTDMPDGSFSKTVFGAWQQAVYDTNDTSKSSTWYLRRTDNTRPDFITEVKEQQAAAKTGKHDSTPVIMHFDTLGRPVLSVDHNRHPVTDADEFIATALQLDAEGNLRSVTNARGNQPAQYKYDMLGNPVYKNSSDTGQRWLLANITSQPLRTWDERNHEFQYTYDLLQRPLQSKVTGGDGAGALNHIFDRTNYGESLLIAGRANEAALQLMNVLGKPISHYDTAGVINTPSYDFKGKPLTSTRRLAADYKTIPNWIDANLANALEADLFTASMNMDALGRITRHTMPDGSVLIPAYNEAGLLNSENILHAGGNEVTYIKDIDYNEKGQRSKIIYGNDVATRFFYDPQTFRLQHINSKKNNNELLQDLFYTYDPAGNITAIEDKAIPVQFFANSVIEPLGDYTYDGLYRLVKATGRENNAALNFGDCDNWNDNPMLQQLRQGGPMAVSNYTQTYLYDLAGNITQMKHAGSAGNWTRNYEYETASNRLKATHIGDNGSPADYTKYTHHNQHGFLLELPHLEMMQWNCKEELVMTTRQHCTDDNIPVITYYQYNGQGQRVRKITENGAAAGAGASKKEERVYIDGYEIYKKFTGANAGLQRTSLNLVDEGNRFVVIETRNNIDDGTEQQLVRYQLHNHIGSATMELDAGARMISYEEYHPYGTTAYRATNSDIKSAAKRYRYTGMERDEETGLEYHSARYYLPWLGRWCSADPTGIHNDPNVYAYCGGKVIAYTDVNGKYDKPGHDILTRLQAIQYMSYDNAVRLGKAANITDMVSEYGAGPFDSAYNKEDLHSLKDQSPEITRNEIREKMKNFKFSDDPNIAIQQFGAYFLHPFEDTYAHTPENMSVPGVPFFGHFSNPEADMTVGTKTEAEFIKERHEWNEFIKSAKEVESLKGLFTENKEITDEDWKKIYRDLKEADNIDAIKHDPGTSVAIGFFSVGVAAGSLVGAGFTAIAIINAGGGAWAALAFTAIAAVGITAAVLGSLGLARLMKEGKVNEGFAKEAQVLDKAIAERGGGEAPAGDTTPSAPQPFNKYCQPVNTQKIEFCTTP